MDASVCTDKIRANLLRSGGWMRETHVTRAAARKTRDVNEERNLDDLLDAVNSVSASEPKSYNQAMKSGLKD